MNDNYKWNLVKNNEFKSLNTSFNMTASGNVNKNTNYSINENKESQNNDKLEHFKNDQILGKSLTKITSNINNNNLLSINNDMIIISELFSDNNEQVNITNNNNSYLIKPNNIITMSSTEDTNVRRKEKDENKGELMQPRLGVEIKEYIQSNATENTLILTTNNTQSSTTENMPTNTPILNPQSSATENTPILNTKELPLSEISGKLTPSPSYVNEETPSIGTLDSTPSIVTLDSIPSIGTHYSTPSIINHDPTPSFNTINPTPSFNTIINHPPSLQTLHKTPSKLPDQITPSSTSLCDGEVSNESQQTHLTTTTKVCPCGVSNNATTTKVCPCGVSNNATTTKVCPCGVSNDATTTKVCPCGVSNDATTTKVCPCGVSNDATTTKVCPCGVSNDATTTKVCPCGVSNNATTTSSIDCVKGLPATSPSSIYWRFNLQEKEKEMENSLLNNGDKVGILTQCLLRTSNCISDDGDNDDSGHNNTGNDNDYGGNNNDNHNGDDDYDNDNDDDSDDDNDYNDSNNDDVEEHKVINLLSTSIEKELNSLDLPRYKQRKGSKTVSFSDEAPMEIPFQPPVHSPPSLHSPISHLSPPSPPPSPIPPPALSSSSSSWWGRISEDSKGNKTIEEDKCNNKINSDKDYNKISELEIISKKEINDLVETKKGTKHIKDKKDNNGIIDGINSDKVEEDNVNKDKILRSKEDGIQRKIDKPRSLGENNPVYRLSMKLSPLLFHMPDIPSAREARQGADKWGYLQKLSGRGLPYLSGWRRRYCVLARGRLYQYEKEDSRSCEKGSAVINLEYYDQVYEAEPKESKKATNVFIITSQDRSFFDPGRQLFSADTLTELQDWVRKIGSTLEVIRNNNRAATVKAKSVKAAKEQGSTTPRDGSGSSKTEGVKSSSSGKKKEEQTTNSNTNSLTKEKKRKKEDTRKGSKTNQPSLLSSNNNIDKSITNNDSKPSTGASSITGQFMLEGLLGMAGKNTNNNGTASGQSNGTASGQSNGSGGKSGSTSTDRKSAMTGSGKTGTTSGGKPVVQSGGKSGTTTSGKSGTTTSGKSGSVSVKKSGSTSVGIKLGFEIPATEVEPQLESVTKYRPRPKDRRAPARRTMAPLKKRASSLGALQVALQAAEEENATNDQQDFNYQQTSNGINRSAPWLNRSVDQLANDDDDHITSSTRASKSHLAYNYSSDEEEMEQHSHSDSFTTSASGFGSPPPPPPRTSSYTGTLKQPPITGPKPLRFMQPLGSLPSLYDPECRSESIEHDWRGSVNSMGASPVMDDLDNILMNQSVQAATPLDSPSSGGSEVSTCKAAGEPAPRMPTPPPETNTPDIDCEIEENSNTINQNTIDLSLYNEKSTKDLNKFATAVHHLQRHAVDLDHSLHVITNDLLDTRADVVTIQDAVLAAKSDIEKVGQTVALLSHEATVASHQIVSAAKEAERTQQLASQALSDAENMKHQHEKLKTDYEELIHELKSAIISLKAGASNSLSRKQHSRRPTDNISSSSLDPKQHQDKSMESQAGMTPPESPRNKASTTKESEQPSKKLSSYQSLFNRPSSIILGLTNRSSLSKSVSFADQPNEMNVDPEQKSPTIECLKETDQFLHKNSSNLYNPKIVIDPMSENKHLNLMQMSTNENKYISSSSYHNKDKLHPEKTNKNLKYSGDHRHPTEREKISSGDHWHLTENVLSGSNRYPIETENVLSNISLDDIPMMDDNLDRPDTHQTGIGISKLKINISSSPTNFNLGKSSSSPAVTVPTHIARSRALPLPKKTCPETSLSTSSSDTPSKPSITILPRTTICDISSFPETTTVTPLYRPGSNPGPLVRQSSMDTVPEDRVVNISTCASKRKGVFAISRQNSTPNLPLQRLNSNPKFPLQKQNSLGTVLDDRHLPRQDSLLSVPEERPITDQTLPLSPSGSISCLPIENAQSRNAIRKSLELVTGPIMSGSSFQEMHNINQGLTNPILSGSPFKMLSGPSFKDLINLNSATSFTENQPDDPPFATSSLKKEHEKKKTEDEIKGIPV